MEVLEYPPDGIRVLSLWYSGRDRILRPPQAEGVARKDGRLRARIKWLLPRQVIVYGREMKEKTGKS